MTEKDNVNRQVNLSEKCTFHLGYIRQPIYACKTCSTEDEPAGICDSCSIACHAEHELIELYPKREFRCDCGIPGKLDNHTCMLMIPAKKILKNNDKNKYNHNFIGRYCRCDQIYDPEKEENPMYQCIACEDWFHERCIGVIPKEIQDFECYLCRVCTKKYPFLLNSNDARFSFGLSIGNENINTWILPKSHITNLTNDDVKIGEKRCIIDSIKPNNTKRLKIECQNADTSLLPKHDNIEVFLQESWRKGLCKCLNCEASYKTHKVEYLLAEENTYEPVEENVEEDIGKALLEIGFEELQRIDRVKVIDSIMLYKALTNEIKTYLESFKVTGKIITLQDIERFFAARKEK